MPKGIPLTQAEFEKRQREIAQNAIELFIEHGFIETSMRQIAKAVGIGKSTLYDYFDSKDDIIVFVVQEHLAALMQRANDIIQEEGNAAEHLHKIMRMQLDFSLKNKAFYLRLMFEAQRLNVESQERIQTHRYAYQDLVKSLIDSETLSQQPYFSSTPRARMYSSSCPVDLNAWK